ncbi:D-alanyl-D-alanine carboxypeptidase [Aquibacillus albus]|uniref:D-alanyl-D-alanine carboxypeptidase n=2 Tax=Aquibacillus albus TaxID=1168171 RepID=A0ABS2MYV0_9BACI|nr:D-alanyl-D-alanine carboxypeptidase [Aquibacillus albus]
MINYFFAIPIDAEKINKPNSLLTESVILMDSKSGQVLYEKNPNKKMYPASITKVATAIYALEKGKLNDIVTVSKRARQVDGTRVYLEEGEKVTLLKLIQGLLINSGNDAGVAIAEHLDGSVERFSDSLNKYLKAEVGLEHTHFKNPHGLFHPEHVTTATDIAKLMQYSMNNEKFQSIIATKELEWIGDAWETTIYNHHKMLGEIPYEGVIGGKNGYVSKSGHTLVTTAERSGLSLIAVTLNGSYPMDTYMDTIDLFDYGFERFESVKIEKGTEYEDELGTVYSVSEDFYFTKYKDQDATVEWVDGSLSVLIGDAPLNTTIPVMKVVNEVEAIEEEAVVSPSENAQENGQEPDHLVKAKEKDPANWPMFIVLFVIAAGVVLFAVKKARQKDNVEW